MKNHKILKNIYLEIKELEQKLIDQLLTMDLTEYIMEAIDEDYFTKKEAGFYHAEVFFTNEVLSHKVKFQKFEKIEFRQLRIDFQFFFNDIKMDLIFGVTTDMGDTFVLILEANQDFSVYDVDYVVL